MKTARTVESHLHRVSSIFACLLLCGCYSDWGTANELEQATDGLSDSITKLVEAQIFHNYKLKKENIDKMPAQVVISTGSTQVSNQIILPSAGLGTVGRLFATLGVQNQNQWQQGWSVSAVVDPGDLQRLDALYRYAVSNDMCEFIRLYDEAYITTTNASSLRLSDIQSDQNLYSDYQTAPKPSILGVLPPADPKNTTVAEAGAPKTADNFTVFHHYGPPANLPFPPQEAATMCAKEGSIKTEDVDTKLKPQQWPTPFPVGPFIEMSRRPNSAWIDKGSHDLHEFFVNRKSFEQFKYWILGATVNTVRPNTSSSPTKGISGSTG